MSATAKVIAENLVPYAAPGNLGERIESLFMVLILVFGLVTPFVGALLSLLN